MMTPRMKKKNASALTAVLFITALSQSIGMVNDSLSYCLPFSTGSHVLHESFLSGNDAEEFCSVITASQGGIVLFGGNVDLRSEEISDRELNATFFPPYEGYGFVVLTRRFLKKGFYTRTHTLRCAGMNEKGLAFAGSGIPLTSLAPHPERPFSGSIDDFIIKVMRECCNVPRVIELAQDFNFGESINGQYHFADFTGDAVVISAGEEGELAFTRKDKGDGYLVSTNFNLAVPESGTYPCWRHETATTMLEDVGGDDDLSVDYAASILDAIHVEGLWVNTAVSYIFDLNSGDIYLYYLHQFEDGARMSVQEELDELNESSLFSASMFSAPLGESLRSQTYFFFQLYSEKTLEVARSEIQQYRRQCYLRMAAKIIVSAVIVSGLFLVAYRKVRNRQKNQAS